MTNRFKPRSENSPDRIPTYNPQVGVFISETNSLYKEKIKYFIAGCIFTALLVLLILWVILSAG